MTPTTSRDTVLLQTHSKDFYTVDLVSQALARKGVRPIRFNTDLFPSSVKLSARAGDHRAAHLVTEAGEQVSAAEVRAVWARKLWTPRMSDDLDEGYRSMCIGESAAALEGFLDALHDARWVNDLDHQRDAENKQRQLRLAACARSPSAWTPLSRSSIRTGSAKRTWPALRHFVIVRWSFKS